MKKHPVKDGFVSYVVYVRFTVKYGMFSESQFSGKFYYDRLTVELHSYEWKRTSGFGD